MLPRVAAPTPDQLVVLRAHPIKDLARVAGVDRLTARSASAGLPVHGLCLRSLLDAAARLAALRAPLAPVPRAHGRPCAQCLKSGAFRRDLCRTCYRKLKDAGLALPPPGRRGKSARDHAARMVAWVRALPPEQRAMLRTALGEVA